MSYFLEGPKTTEADFELFYRAMRKEMPVTLSEAIASMEVLGKKEITTTVVKTHNVGPSNLGTISGIRYPSWYGLRLSTLTICIRNSLRIN